MACSSYPVNLGYFPRLWTVDCPVPQGFGQATGESQRIWKVSEIPKKPVKFTRKIGCERDRRSRSVNVFSTGRNTTHPCFSLFFETPTSHDHPCILAGSSGAAEASCTRHLISKALRRVLGQRNSIERWADCQHIFRLSYARSVPRPKVSRSTSIID
jgi:hypothetical protein